MTTGASRASSPASATRRTLLQAVLQKARRRASADALKHEQLSEFLPAYYANVDDDDLQARATTALANYALRHFQHGLKRRPQQTLLELYNPEAAQPGIDGHTVINIVADDLPFLVDSICMVLARFSLNIHLMVHPVLSVARDGRGLWRRLSTDAPKESWQRYEVDQVSDPQKLIELHDAIESALQDVSRACADWQAMRKRALTLCTNWQRTPPPVDRTEAQEATAFLQWLADNHFTFLGSQEFKLQRGASVDVLQPVGRTALGLMQRDHAKEAHAIQLAGELRAQARASQLVLITKSATFSTVHRAAHLDQISIKHFDARGRVIGETRFLGLFTSTVYSTNPHDVPMLRHKLDRVINTLDLLPGSHDAKAVQHVIDNYPRDELFQSSTAELARTIRGIVNLYERRKVRLFLRRDPFHRFYSGLLYLPRDRYNTQVRERIEGHLLAALRGSHVESQVLMSDSALARLHLLVRTTSTATRNPNENALEQDITHLIRTWHDELAAALIALHGNAEGRQLADYYGQAFPAAYQADVSPAAAVGDIAQLRKVADSTDSMELRLTEMSGHLHLRIIRRGTPLPLSDVLPVLENLGLRVLTERPYEIEPQRARTLWIQDFALELGRDSHGAAPGLNDLFHDAFIAIWQQRIENDGFNRLIVKCLLGWREVNVLRAYCRYLLQSGVSFSQAYMEQTLAKHAGIAASLWQLFAARFDPAIKTTERESRINKLTKQIEADLESVSSPDEDRILRSYLVVINASMRSNYYQLDADGKHRPQLSFKLRSAAIPHLPLPKPLFEIFVHSPRVEGVHLRMGMVARGGLRWSDRREDFRTEVLGLMKAQNVKNSVIVPMGAKGGFVPKRIATGAPREEVQREGTDCYRSFVRGLLDITDNIIGGKTITPDNVVRHDDQDPYLVVAADKGTATFSDIANGVAAEYNFWLGDAFASGGSAGYDHKKMAITARGGWECVKRHCREIGIDVDTQEFTASGIGDMAGDVFGNGALRSPHMKLLAAFNHQHIFIDPTPDAAASFKERQRLFDLPRSSWEDYNSKLISKGGGVYSRSAKSITVSAEAQKVLGIHTSTLAPQALIQAILRMPVDLLWNGGIGTYVKASSESHLDVGDRSNDGLRVNGNELRCKIVGEGGNLGFTQRGRIEYALSGGRLNTDFIDNSAGVDCSDHEVNIKILLSLADQKTLPTTKRNALLAGMTEDMAQLVLRDNYLQSLALSMAAQDGRSRLQEHAHLIRSLEQTYGLDRNLEALPDAETIKERQQAGLGLTRPELSVLLSYSKMALYKQLISSDIADDPYLALELQRYFPPALSKRFARQLPKHRLAREIIATATTNSLVNRMGPSFAMRAEEDTGADAAHIARAYTIAREAYQMRDLWAKIEALDNKIPAALQYEMLNASARLLRFVTYWLLDHYGKQLQIEQQVARLQPGIAELSATLPKIIPALAFSAKLQQLSEPLRSNNVPEKLTQQIMHLDALCSGPDIVELATQHHRTVAEAAALYFGLDKLLSLDWLRTQIMGLKTQDRWQALARNTLRDQLYALQRGLCTQIFKASPKANADAALSSWQKRNDSAIKISQQSLQDIQAGNLVEFASLSVALQAVRRLMT